MPSESSSKTALVTGATGMVGGRVLECLLAEPRVAKVITLGRRATGRQHDKLQEIIHDDFLDLSCLARDLTGIDACFHCLAAYQSQVSKSEYVEITCEYQRALTDALVAASPHAAFVLFGASGADPTERSMASFARVKGRAENLLNASSLPKKYIFRPGYIHPTGARYPPGLSYKLFGPLTAAAFKLVPRVGVTDLELARAMVMIGLERREPSGIFSNQMIRDRVASGRG